MRQIDTRPNKFERCFPAGSLHRPDPAGVRDNRGGDGHLARPLRDGGGGVEAQGEEEAGARGAAPAASPAVVAAAGAPAEQSEEIPPGEN